MQKGALRIFRRALDWNPWVTFRFEGFADPHSSIPYVQNRNYMVVSVDFGSNLSNINFS